MWQGWTLLGVGTSGSRLGGFHSWSHSAATSTARGHAHLGSRFRQTPSRSGILLWMHAADVGGGCERRHRDRRVGAEGARVALVPGVPPFVDPNVATLSAAEVAKGALVGLDPRVGPLVHANLATPAGNDLMKTTRTRRGNLKSNVKRGLGGGGLIMLVQSTGTVDAPALRLSMRTRRTCTSEHECQWDGRPTRALSRRQ